MSEADACTVWVRGLPSDVSSADDIATRLSRLSGCAVKRVRTTTGNVGEFEGFCFIDFDAPYKSVSKAVSSMNGVMWKGARLQLQRAKPDPRTAIYGLPCTTNETGVSVASSLRGSGDTASSSTPASSNKAETIRTSEIENKLLSEPTTDTKTDTTTDTTAPEAVKKPKRHVLLKVEERKNADVLRVRARKGALAITLPAAPLPLTLEQLQKNAQQRKKTAEKYDKPHRALLEEEALPIGSISEVRWAPSEVVSKMEAMQQKAGLLLPIPPLPSRRRRSDSSDVSDSDADRDADGNGGCEMTQAGLASNVGADVASAPVVDTETPAVAPTSPAPTTEVSDNAESVVPTQPVTLQHASSIRKQVVASGDAAGKPALKITKATKEKQHIAAKLTEAPAPVEPAIAKAVDAPTADPVRVQLRSEADHALDILGSLFASADDTDNEQPQKPGTKFGHGEENVVDFTFVPKKKRAGASMQLPDEAVVASATISGKVRQRATSVGSIGPSGGKAGEQGELQNPNSTQDADVRHSTRRTRTTSVASAEQPREPAGNDAPPDSSVAQEPAGAQPSKRKRTISTASIDAGGALPVSKDADIGKSGAPEPPAAKSTKRKRAASSGSIDVPAVKAARKSESHTSPTIHDSDVAQSLPAEHAELDAAVNIVDPDSKYEINAPWRQLVYGAKANTKTGLFSFSFGGKTTTETAPVPDMLKPFSGVLVPHTDSTFKMSSMFEGDEASAAEGGESEGPTADDHPIAHGTSAHTQQGKAGKKAKEQKPPAQKSKADGKLKAKSAAAAPAPNPASPAVLSIKDMLSQAGNSFMRMGSTAPTAGMHGMPSPSGPRTITPAARKRLKDDFRLKLKHGSRQSPANAHKGKRRK